MGDFMLDGVTTSSTANGVPFGANRFLHILTIVFLIVWVVSAVSPGIPEDWLLENIVVVLLVGVLIATYRWLALSDLSYLLIFHHSLLA